MPYMMHCQHNFFPTSSEAWCIGSIPTSSETTLQDLIPWTRHGMEFAGHGMASPQSDADTAWSPADDCFDWRSQGWDWY